jgi:hypothetical protein
MDLPGLASAARAGFLITFKARFDFYVVGLFYRPHDHQP